MPTNLNIPGDPAIFKAILSHITDNVIVIDTQYKVICCNDVARNTLRSIHKRDIKAGDDHREFVVEENMPIYLRSFEKALSGETVIVEKEITTEDKKVWLLFRLTPVFDEQKKVIAVTFIATDIDAGKRKEAALRQSEEKISKYNRELSLLNQINDIILKATDENELYNAVCKCINTRGGYNLAWIGFYPEKNENGDLVVTPLVAYGIADYLKAIKISLNDPALSKGPTATVLLTGEKVITNNVHRSALFTPWLQQANKYGISASIVLPLTFGNNKTGTLNIYSADVDAFEKHEVAILERLANNLSLAVQGIRTRNDMLHTRYLLKERVKELSTIYQVHDILQDVEQSIEEIFTRIVNILPPGWQYPEICEAKIEFNGQTFTTGGYKPSQFSQATKIETQDGRKGFIEVIYTAETKMESEGPFLKEERDLINTIADTIQVYFNKKSNQDALANSEARFRGAFEHAAIGMAIVSLTGQWIMVNKELCDMTGYTEAELLSTTFQQITHPDDKANDIVPVQELIAGARDFYRREKRYIHKNGSVVWVNLNSAVVKDRYAQPQYFITQIENVTARKESELKFRDLVEKSLVGVYIIQNERFAYVNPRIIEESGYPEEELMSMPIDKFVHKEDVDLVRKNVQARLTGALDKARYEVRATSKDGSLMWLEMFGSTTLYRGAPAIIGTMVNITEKKQVYNELERSEANMRSIFNNTQGSFLLLDDQINILAYNEYFASGYAEQTGYELKTGANFLDLRLPEKREALRNIFETVRENGKPLEYETVYGNKVPIKYFDVTVSPILNNGLLIGFCVVGFDITKRKNLEIERQKIVADLISRNRDLQEFAQIVSHNLRGPLATILGLTNMFKGGITEPEKDFILEGIGISAEKLDSVVRELNNILDAKSDSTETRAMVHLDGVVEEVKVSFANLIENTRAVIAVDFSGTNELFTLRSFMFNILYSLISNSLKYSDKKRSPHIKVWTEQHIGEVWISVRDNGVGVDMKKHGDQLFLLNKRFQNTTEGKGLGLFLVKAQVGVLNGSIEMNSEPGIGTTVKIILPV